MSRDDKIDALIADIDDRMARQVSEIRRHPAFRTLARRWRALHFLVKRTNFRENTKLELLNVSKEDLLMDFEDSPEIPKSGLYKIVYSAEYGPFGGRPYGLLLADYSFGAGPQDVALLQNCAAVASMACCVFVAAGNRTLLQDDASTTKWRAFQASADSRCVGLVHPRLDGRGIASFGVAVARSFALYRTCVNIVGPEAGRIEGFCPKTAHDHDTAEELAAKGLIPIRADAESGEAIIHAAPSCLGPGNPLPEGLEPEDEELHRQLPALFLIQRFAQYLKILQREQIGSWKERPELEAQLGRYLRNYVAGDGVVLSLRGEELRAMVLDDPEDDGRRAVFDDYLQERDARFPFLSRTRPPLREVRFGVHDVPGHAGYYTFELRLQPNWGYGGRFFTLALTGKLDKD